MFLLLVLRNIVVSEFFVLEGFIMGYWLVLIINWCIILMNVGLILVYCDELILKKIVGK